MEKVEKIEKRCHCPYCDISVSAPAVLCGGCGTKLSFCKDCGCSIPRTAKKCPGCGAEQKTTRKSETVSN